VATATKKAETTQAKAETNGHQWWSPSNQAGRDALAKVEIVSTVLQEADDQAYRDVGVSKAGYLVVEVPDKEGYIYDLARLNDRYVATLTRKDFVETPAPPPEPVRPQLPPEFAKLEGEELRAAFAEYYTTTERAHNGLRRHAIRAGYCSTYDRIMEHHGFTGRKRRARVKFRLSVPTTYSAEYIIRNFIGGEHKDATGEISVPAAIEVKMDGDFDRFPAKDTPILDHFPEEKIRAEIDKVVGSNRNTRGKIVAQKVDLSAVVVTSVTGDQGQEVW
jgi:hypothetical protein